jgi:hypothetical protein
MKLSTSIRFIKNWCNLCHYQHFAISFGSGYATSGVNYVKKNYEIGYRHQIHKNVDVIYATIGILP